jgi:hypothetical protein
MNARERQLELLLEGPDVKGRISVDYLTSLAKELQTTLMRIAQDRRTGRGRYSEKVRQACRLDLVSFKKSSARLGFELAGQPTETLFGEVGQEAVRTLLDALALSHKDEDHWATELPPSVLGGLDRITKPLENGVTAIHFSARDRSSLGPVKIDRRFRRALRKATESDREPNLVDATGVVWEADWKDHTAELHQPDGTMIRLRFDADRDEDVTAARKCPVRARGVGHYAGQRLQWIDLRHIEILGAPVEDQTVTDFWSGPTVDELAAEQGVAAVEDLDALAGDWPKEDSLDEFLESLRRVRV